MTRIRRAPINLVAATLAALFTAATTSLATAQESRESKIARAMKAAPESVSRDATITDTDGTVLRPGSNGWHCQPGLAPGDDHPICNDAVGMELMKALGAKAAFTTDRVGISYMLGGDAHVNNADPFDTKPDSGEAWVQEGPPLMIIVPDPAMLEGLPDDPSSGGAYVMWKGTPYAHLMIRVGPRPPGK